MRGHLTEETREKISAGLRRAWAEGRRSHEHMRRPEVVAARRAGLERFAQEERDRKARIAAEERAAAEELTRHAADCSCSLACELTSMRARTAARRARSA